MPLNIPPIVQEGNAPLTPSSRVEAVLLTFLRDFFSQDSLSKGHENTFRFVDNVKPGSLIVSMSYDSNNRIPNAVPAVLLQDLGFVEELAYIDHMMVRHLLDQSKQIKIPLRSSFALHCVAQERGAAKRLAEYTAFAIIVFRHELLRGGGLEHLAPINVSPPSPLKTAEDLSTQWVSMINLSILHTLDAEITPRGPLEEQVEIQILGGVDSDSSSVLLDSTLKLGE